MWKIKSRWLFNVNKPILHKLKVYKLISIPLRLKKFFSYITLNHMWDEVFQPKIS